MKFNSKLVFRPNTILTTPTMKIDFANTFKNTNSNKKTNHNSDPDNLSTTIPSTLKTIPYNPNYLNRVINDIKDEINNLKGFYEGNCFGVSANQIGYNIHLFLIRKYPLSPKLKQTDVIINGEIIETSKSTSLKWEGCISDKENLLLIERPESIKIKYNDINGNIKREWLKPVRSRIAQHEIDHCEGIDIYTRKIVDVIEINKLYDSVSGKNTMMIEEWYDKQISKGYLF